MIDGITTIRLVLTAVALVLWGYGFKVDDANIRLVAMGILVVSLLVRWAGRLMKKPPDATE